MRNKYINVIDCKSCLFDGGESGLTDCIDSPTENFLSFLRDIWPINIAHTFLCCTAHRSPWWIHRDRIAIVGIRPPHNRSDTWSIRCSNNNCTCSIGEDKGGGAIIRICEIRNLFYADNKNFLGSTGKDKVMSHRDCVAKSGTGSADIKGGSGGITKASNNGRCSTWRLMRKCNRGDDDGINFCNRDTGTL